MEFTRSYLEHIIKIYGPDQHVLSTNCGGKPTRPYDYVYDYGTVSELLKELDEKESLSGSR